MLEFMIESSVLILLVLVLRRVFTGRVNYRILYGLWGIVALRLLIPVTLVGTPFSVMNLIQPSWIEQRESGQSTEAVRTEKQESRETAGKNSKVRFGQETDSSPKKDGTAPVSKNKANQSPDYLTGLNGSRTTQESFVKIAYVIWAVGSLLCLFVVLWTNISLSRRLIRERLRPGGKISVQGKPAVYQTGEFSSPCLYGVFRPAIYLPEILVKTYSAEKIEQMVLHERVHYRHLDHIWSFVRILLVSVYWFHPLIWLAASLSKKDAELACDESVMAGLDREQREAYGAMLIDVAKTNGREKLLYSAAAMSRGGRSLEKRIRAISETKKYSRKLLPPLFVIVLLVMGVTFTGVSRDKSGGGQSQSKKENASVTIEKEDTVPDTDAKETPGVMDEAAYKNLLGKIAKVMPEAVVQELQSSGSYKVLDMDTIIIGNSKKEQDITLRLDFVYESGILEQYRSKEYGFVDSLPEERITKEKGKRLAERFAEEFLGRTVELVRVENAAGYDNGNYITFMDEQGGTYLVQLNHNIVVHYDAPAENITQSAGNKGY